MQQRAQASRAPLETRNGSNARFEPLDGITSPVRVLLEETDPLRRSEAHLALGQQAMARQELDAATDHFREAADLDPTDERPKSLLRSIGAEKPKRRGVFQFLFGR